MSSKYVMRQDIVDNYTKYGMRPQYFNTEGAMDELLKGIPFEGSKHHDSSHITVMTANLYYYVVRLEDTMPYDLILDNRRIGDV